jgi:hypothetical protein
MLNDYVFNGSHGWKHTAELTLQILQHAAYCCHIPSITRLRDFFEMDDGERRELLRFDPCVVFLNTDEDMITII